MYTTILDLVPRTGSGLPQQLAELFRKANQIKARLRSIEALKHGAALGSAKADFTEVDAG